MIRDVLVASMNKGQLPGAGLVLILLSLIWKMAPADVSRLVFALLADFEKGSTAGWVLAVIIAVAWAIHARSQRKLISEEMRRIGIEKSVLQGQSLPGKIKSSERR